MRAVRQQVMIRACLIIATFIVGYAKPSWADITENDIHTVLRMNQRDVQTKQRAMQTQMRARVHIAYAFADWLMEQASNPATHEDRRGRYVNMAHLVLMGYGFGGVSETPATPAEWKIARRAGSSIGFITKQPGGLEPTLSDDGPIQLHWYNLYRFLDQGIQDRERGGFVEPPALPVNWTWDVPKTIFRPSMYYRGEKNQSSGMIGSFRKLSGGSYPFEWPYYYSMKDILAEYVPYYGDYEELPAAITYGIRLNTNYLGNRDDFLHHHGLGSSTVVHSVKRENTGELVEHNDLSIQWMLNRIPVKDRVWLIKKLQALTARLYTHKTMEARATRESEALIDPQLLYLCTFYSLEEQERFLALVQRYCEPGEGGEASTILFETRRLSLREKEIFFDTIRDGRIKRLSQWEQSYFFSYLATVPAEYYEQVKNKLLEMMGFYQIHTLIESALKPHLKGNYDFIGLFAERLIDLSGRVAVGLAAYKYQILQSCVPHILGEDADWNQVVEAAITQAQERQERVRQEQEQLRRAQEAERLRWQAILGEQHAFIRAHQALNPTVGINVHAGDRDARTLLAVQKLIHVHDDIFDNLGTDFNVQTELAELETFIRAGQGFSADVQEKALRALNGPVPMWGSVRGNATLGGIKLENIYANFWHFCKTYQTDAGYKNPMDPREGGDAHTAMKIALVKSMADGVDVCPQGKSQRTAIAILQGRLGDVNIDGIELVDEATRIRMQFELLRMSFAELMAEADREKLTVQEQYRQKINEFLQEKEAVITVPAQLADYRQRVLDQLEGYLQTQEIPTYNQRDRLLEAFVQYLATLDEVTNYPDLRGIAADWAKDQDFDLNDTIPKYLADDERAQAILTRVQITKQNIHAAAVLAVDEALDAERREFAAGAVTPEEARSVVPLSAEERRRLQAEAAARRIDPARNAVGGLQ